MLAWLGIAARIEDDLFERGALSEHGIKRCPLAVLHEVGGIERSEPVHASHHISRIEHARRIPLEREPHLTGCDRAGRLSFRHIVLVGDGLYRIHVGHEALQGPGRPCHDRREAAQVCCGHEAGLIASGPHETFYVGDGCLLHIRTARDHDLGIRRRRHREGTREQMREIRAIAGCRAALTAIFKLDGHGLASDGRVACHVPEHI